MKTQREYIPANIRAGYTVQEAAKMLNGELTNPRVQVRTYNHGRDVNGNGTAHYSVFIICDVAGLNECTGFLLVSSGKRREQVGYSGRNDAALYALSKLGFEVDISKCGSYDYQGSAVYPLLNFPPVERK